MLYLFLHIICIIYIFVRFSHEHIKVIYVNDIDLIVQERSIVVLNFKGVVGQDVPKQKAPLNLFLFQWWNNTSSEFRRFSTSREKASAFMAFSNQFSFVPIAQRRSTATTIAHASNRKYTQ